MVSGTSDSRIRSIDAFRGYAILNVIFFNALDGVPKIPGWMQHAPEGSNHMTYVDIGVPSFLFIVGMAIPLALKARQQRGRSRWSIWRHILLRSLALIVMGSWMVFKIDDFDPVRVGISQSVWGLWMYLGYFLLWYWHPVISVGRLRLNTALRVAGALLLAWLAFRYHHGMQTDTLLPGWWGILGIIGWSYLLGCILYTMAGRYIGLVLLAGVALLPAWYAWLGSDFGVTLNTVLVLAGAFVSHRLFLHPPAGESTGRKILWVLAAIPLCWLIGRVYERFGGISKILNTPAFVMYGLASALLIFLVFFVVVDGLRFRRVVGIFMPAARFPLTAYLLSELVYDAGNVVGLWPHLERFSEGMAAILCSSVITAILTLVIFGLSRLNLHLDL